MPQYINKDDSFRSAEGSGFDFDEPTHSSNRSTGERAAGWSHRLGGVVVDMLCVVLAAGVTITFVLNRFFSEGRQDAGDQDADDIADDDSVLISAEGQSVARAILNIMIGAFLAIMIGLVIVVQRY